MSTVFSEGFESGSNSVTITTSNTAYSVIVGSGGAIFDNNIAAAGSLSAKLSASGGTTIALREIFSGGSVTSRYFRRYFSVNAFPLASTPITLIRIRLSSTTVGQVVLLSTGALQIKDGTSIVATSTNTVSLNSWFRIEWHIDGTSNAAQTARLFIGSNYNGTTPTEILAGSYSGGSFDRVEDGIGTANFSGSLWLDEVDDDSSTWPGPSGGADEPPVANAGSNQSVTSAQLVTLNGSGSSDPDGSIASYAWSQTSGTTVTLSDPTASQPTFTAPPVTNTPITLGFGLIVTDNLGVQSSQSTVAITVNPPAPSAFNEDFENGTAGTSITSSNSTYSTVSGTPVPTFDNSVLVSGLVSANFNGTGANTPTLNQNMPSAATLRYMRRYFRISNYPSASLTLVRLRLTTNNSATVGQVILTGTGTLQIRNGTTTVATSTHTITPNTWFRLEWYVDGTTTNTQTLKIFLLGNYNSSSPDETISGAYTTGSFNQISDGVGTGIFTGTLWLDGVADSTTAYLGPMVSANQAPVANAGNNQTVSPSTVVTLSGTGSHDPDGIITSYIWSQTGGSTVVLSSWQVAQPTFTSPSTGTTMTFGLIAIDNLGAGSNAAAVTITDDAATAAFSESFENGSNGVTITSANVNYGTISGTATFDTSHTAAGLQSAKMIGTGTTATTFQETLTVGEASRYMRRYFYLTAMPTGAVVITLIRLRSASSATVGQVVLSTNGILQIRDANTVVASSTTAMTPNTWFRLEWYVDGTTTNTQTLRIYSGNLLNSAVTPSQTLSGVYDQGAFTKIQDGIGTAGYTGTLWLDEAQDQLSNWPGPAAGTNQPPIVSAGSNQTVLPGDTIILDGSESYDPDGSIASYAWSQTSGTTVTLSDPTAVQPTFVAPTLASSSTLSFDLVVTDNNGLISQVGTTSVTVQPTNEFVVHGGAWQTSAPNIL